MVPLIRGECVLLPDRIFLATVLALLCASTGAWLLAASSLQDEAVAQRKDYIEQFISSEPGSEPPVPTRFESFPTWLRLWEGINLLGYFFVMSPVLYALFRLANP